MVLYVDDRENDVVIHKLFSRLGNRDHGEGLVQVKRLHSADYIIGDWGIEAKEINDLYHSILGHGRSRTIVGQLTDLQDNFRTPMLVVYGSSLRPFIPGRKRRPSRKDYAIETRRMEKTILNFKSTFQLRFPGIAFMQLNTMDDFVEFLVTAHTQKVQLDAGEIPKQSPNILTLDPQVIALSSIPGVTHDQAIDMLTRLGSLRNILRLRTRQKDLMETPGVGRTKARRILYLREDYKSEVSDTEGLDPE